MYSVLDWPFHVQSITVDFFLFHQCIKGYLIHLRVNIDGWDQSAHHAD